MAVLRTSPEVEEDIEISVVIPCLNEAETLGLCLDKARQALTRIGRRAEIVVVDNGSEDGSPDIARQRGATVIRVDERGYGSALMAGIAGCHGRVVVMGDADDSYDFLEIPRFVEKLDQQYELVQGCRLPSGGGRSLPGAMPFSHRWIGNPGFSLLSRRWFRTPFHDVYCGMRAFTRQLYDRLELQCTGMEFATEMIIKASLLGARATEVPITLHPDGRLAHRPHLKTFRDGWRTLRLFLLYTPGRLFLAPGLALMLLGLLGYALALPGARVLGATLDAHTLVIASLAIVSGYEAVLFAVLATTFGMVKGLRPPPRALLALFRRVDLEHGLFAAAAAIVAGLVLCGAATHHWWRMDFGPLDYADTMRRIVPGATLIAIGVQTLFASFFVSLMGMGYR
jgi:glycosyltransferase involved in cell wall biosynthesis